MSLTPPRFAFWLFLAGCLITASCVSAQDVSLSPIRWLDADDPPDEPPAFKRRPPLEFPRELRETPDIGYVVYENFIDSSGRSLMFKPHATLEAYHRVNALPLYERRFTPARRQGQPVNSLISFTTLFNPASAAARASTATPRLLDITVIPLPHAREERTSPTDDWVVSATVTVDEHGRVSAIENVPPELMDETSQAARSWRFAPARRDGHPVAATVRLPLIFVPRQRESLAPGDIPPRAIHQPPPLYPFSMRASGMRGEVLLDFVVDIEGRVRRVTVARSLNRGFDDAAIEAVQRWRFEPARRAGVPVAVHVQCPMVFHLDHTFEEGSDGMEVVKKADRSKLPAPFRYDTAPRLTGSVQPVFPYPLLAAHRKGKASVVYVVGESGRVIEARIKEATAPEFGEALLTAVEQFTYEPALKDGRPCPALLGFSQEFNFDERYRVVRTDDLRLLRREQKKPATIAAAHELDSTPELVSRPQSHFPLAMLQKSAKGDAVIEFLIDEDGRVRLPRIVSCSDEAFGYAAVQNLSQWRFKPPQRSGKPVVTRARIPIAFKSASGEDPAQPSP